MEHEFERTLENLVRVGIVTDVNNDKYIARVKFEDINMTSEWMAVLDSRPYIPDYDVPQRTEYEEGGAGDPAFMSHKHDLIIKQWMPKVNDHVLVIYLPVPNGQGFVIGRYHPWA